MVARFPVIATNGTAQTREIPYNFAQRLAVGQNLAIFEGVAHKILLVPDGVLCPCDSCTVSAFEQEAQHGTGYQGVAEDNLRHVGGMSVA